MAWETGTASSHLDLVAKLVTFLTTNASLVAAGQNWTALRNSALPFTGALPTGRIAFFAINSGADYPDPWPTNVPSANVKMEISGAITAPSAGTYTFGLKADDMAEVWIDGTKVTSIYSASVASWTSGTIALTAGAHSLLVRYYGGTPQNQLSLGWQKPGDSAVSVVPAASLSGLALVWNSPGYGAATTASGLLPMFNAPDVVLRGPGLAGADQVVVGLNFYVDPVGDAYNVLVRGLTGYNPLLTLDGQPGQASPLSMPVWNQPMKYWFVGNGRRFIVIAKVSTVYSSMYAGFGLPYGLPTEIPYPMIIGASCTTPTLRWSDQSNNSSSFWNPSSTAETTATLNYRNISGAWEYFANRWSSVAPGGRVYPEHGLTSMRTAPDGSYALQPFVLYNPANGFNVHGEFDGVLHVSGYGNAAENIISVGGVDYLVVQSGFRTTGVDYAAIALQ